MSEVDTHPDLVDCVAEYAYGRGGCTMVEICYGLGDNFQMMAWECLQQFMEDMICRSMQKIQSLYHFREGTRLSPERWAQGLVLKLLKITGQWILDL